jgi:flagellar export protein FliJ
MGSMRRFEFSLEPVLQLRRHREERAQLDLAAQQSLLAREQAQLAELYLERQRHDHFRALLQQSEMDVRALVDTDRYAEALDRTLLLQEERVAAVEAAVVECLEALRHRHMERDALQRLRERQLETHREEGLRLEQQSLDESFLLRWRSAPATRDGN